MADKVDNVHCERLDTTNEEILEETTLKVLNLKLATVLEESKPNQWGPGYIRLYLCCGLMFLCSTMNGYDASLMGSINALPSYTTYMGLPAEGNASTGIVFAIYNVGQMVAALFVWMNDWIGRRAMIAGGCFGVCIATIVASTAQDLRTFIGSRFLLSFFSTFAAISAPLYLIELAPPQYRGTVAGMYNTLFWMGSIIATCAVYGSEQHLTGTTLEWRLPLWCQMICPGMVVLGIYFCPESPRWLIGKGRADEARATIARYHANGDADHPLVNLEMNEMTESLRQEGMTSFRTFFDLRVLFKSHSRRYRMMLNITFSWFGQFSGNNIASYYLPLLVARVGIKDVSTQLLLNIVYAIGGWIPAIIGARLHDVVGRRKMLMISTLSMALCLAVTAGTAAGYVHTGSKAVSAASISFIYIFGAAFAIAYTSMQPIYVGEVLTNDMRAKGMGVYQLTAGLASFVNTYAAPVALNKIGYWFYVFFVFWDLFEFVIIYFFYVETKGRTLEELDEIFESPNPRKASTAVAKVRRRTVVTKSGEKHVDIVDV